MVPETDPLIVSFVTNDGYRVYADRLREQCSRVGMDCHVDILEPFAETKREACLYRPQWMLDLLARFRRPLVWFDADGDILEAFDIPDAEAGFVDNPWRHPDNPVTAGIFMTRSAGLLEAWRDSCAEWRPGEIGSHRRLCWVMDTVDWQDMTPHVKGRVVLRGAAGTDERRL